jgi:hypothetical protein
VSKQGKVPCTIMTRLNELENGTSLLLFLVLNESSSVKELSNKSKESCKEKLYTKDTQS